MTLFNFTNLYVYGMSGGHIMRNGSMPLRPIVHLDVYF